MPVQKEIKKEVITGFDLSLLTPHPDNKREGDIGAISESMRVNGDYGFILAQKKKVKGRHRILKGNHSYQAKLALGHEAGDVVLLDVNDNEALNILLSDNATSDKASYDRLGLAELLQGLSSRPEGLEGTGYDGDDLQQLLDDIEFTVPSPVAGADETHLLKDSYNVLVTCGSENQQTQLLERFLQEGLQCRALIS
jgi:hypothetical protein